MAFAPLVLNISSNGRQVILKNPGFRRIVSFRLGEVTKKNGASKLTHITSPIAIEIDAGQELINSKKVIDELKGSHKGRAELRVVEVTFEGGLVWRYGSKKAKIE
jgi:hypothetical protein